MSLFSALHLRTRLVLMALCAVVPALVVIAYTQSLERANARKRVLEDSKRISRLAANQQATVLVYARRLLVALSQVPSLRESDPGPCNELLAPILRSLPTFVDIWVVKADGTPFCSGVRPGPRPGESGLGRSWFERVVETRATAVGDGEIDGSKGKPVLVLAQPLLGSSGELERVAAAGIGLSPLSWVTLQAQLPRTATLTLSDRQGTVLLRVPDGADRTEKSVRSLDRRVGASDVETVAADGIPRLYATAALETGFDSGLSAEVAVERDAAFAEANHLLRQQGWLLALVLLVTVATALVVGEWFVARPVSALADVTRQLAGGDFTARARLAGGVPGLTELGVAVNSMAVALEARDRERRLAEEQLRVSEERYRVPFESTPYPSFLHDLETFQFIEVNRAACEQYGYTRDEFLRMTIEDIRPPGEMARVLEAIDRITNNSMLDPRWNVTHKKKDGTLFTVEVSAMMVTVGGRRAMIVVAHDISERHRLEGQLRQAQKMDAMGRLAGGIAHDFNNILTAILGYGELALAGLSDDNPAKGDVYETHRAAERATGLTRHLLAFSRQQAFELQVLDLNRLLADLDKMLRRIIREDIDVSVDLTRGLWATKVDPSQIEQVVVNLVVNAGDAMPDGGRLRLETANALVDEQAARHHPGLKPGEYVVLRVADTGSGMTAQVQAHLFEPFFTTKAEGKGTGLGLATVYGIVQQSGGFIEVDSALGRGTTCTIYLPRASAPIDELRERLQPVAPRGRETVLLVEDEIGVRKLSARILARQGYVVLEAGCGEDAIRQHQEHGDTIDLLLTDIVMPGMNGRVLTTRLRCIKPTLKVLWMSGYTGDAGLYEQNEGEPALLAKPFHAAQLVTAVRAALDHRS